MVARTRFEELRVLVLARDAAPILTLNGESGRLAEQLVIEQTCDIDDCIARARQDGRDAILLDSGLGKNRTAETISLIRSKSPAVPVIILADESDSDADPWLQLGAQDVLSRSELSLGVLPRVVRYAIEHMRSATEEARLADLALSERGKSEVYQREIAALSTAVRRINSGPDVSVTIDSLLDMSIELTEGDTAGIALTGPDGDIVRFEAARGIDAELVAGLVFPIDGGVTGAAARSDSAIVVQDATTDPPWISRDLAVVGGFRSALFVPLRSGTERIGVIVALSRRPGTFTRKHEHQLSHLAEYVALAIEHPRRRSEYEAAQAALQRSEQEFHLVIEHASDAIVVLEEDATIRYASPAIERIMGYQTTALGDRSFFDYIEAEDRGMAMTAYRTATGNPSKAELVDLRVRHQDGSVRMLSVAMTNLLDQPAVAGVVVNLRDVTEHHRMADQLRQAQKLEAIGRLAGGVAHDFNNLLTVINGFSDLILTGLPSADSKRGYVNQIIQAGNSGATLTRQLLAFSRQQVLSPRVLNLNSVVDGTESMLRRIIGEDVELSLDLADDLGQVVADPGQIEQAIVNLAVYARGRMPSGGKLIVRSRNVSARDPILLQYSRARSIQQVSLSISDTGPPIEEVTQTQIFEPFLRHDSSASNTGLGLAAVYGIVKQSDGDIFLTSAVGEATSFLILLPRVDAAAHAAPEPRPSNEVVTPGATVLLVEDEDRVRSFIRLVLQNNGYRVLEADRGEAGLAVSRSHDGPIQVLVTDIVMPGIGGRQLAEQLLRERPNLRIVYMSGYTDDEVIRYGVLGPGASFIAKPFAPTTLALTVRQVLDAD